MAFTDPTSGAGYAFGQTWPSAHATQLAAQSGRALDIIGGGTHTMTGTSLTVARDASQAIEWQVPQTVADGSTMTFAGGTNYPRLSSRTILRPQPLIIAGVTEHGGSPNFGVLNTVGFAGVVAQVYVDASGANDPAAIFPLTNVPDLCTMTAVGVRIDPDAHASDPAEMPALTLVRTTPTGGRTTLATLTDSTTGSGFTDAHTLTISGLSEAIDHNANLATYHLHFAGENGANSAVNLLILGLWATFTADRIAP